jgi:hypothetical protein
MLPMKQDLKRSGHDMKKWENYSKEWKDYSTADIDTMTGAQMRTAHRELLKQTRELQEYVLLEQALLAEFGHRAISVHPGCVDDRTVADSRKHFAFSISWAHERIGANMYRLEELEKRLPDHPAFEIISARMVQRTFV